MRMLHEIRLQCAVMQTTQRNRIVIYPPVQRTVAHEVDWRFKHSHNGILRVARQAKTNRLIAARHIAFKALAIPVICPAFVCKYRLTLFIFAHKYAIMVFRVFVQQSESKKSTNRLRGNPSLPEVCKHATVIRAFGR